MLPGANEPPLVRPCFPTAKSQLRVSQAGMARTIFIPSRFNFDYSSAGLPAQNYQLLRDDIALAWNFQPQNCAVIEMLLVYLDQLLRDDAVPIGELLFGGFG
ncbi:hypothetical protein KM043_011623 [Ampulex compressa]|nr:hypothetical protein KM043_011623 [Ampulex compressa]